MKNRLLEALAAIPVAELSYSEWVRVGMALQAEGVDCSVWNEWSKNDNRFHEGECFRKWRSFHGGANQIRGGTIIHMAELRGWKPSNGTIGWNDGISNDFRKDGGQVVEASMKKEITGSEKKAMSQKKAVPVNPGRRSVKAFEAYLKALFREGDYVAYTTEAWKDSSGKWLPKPGCYDRTAGELLASLEKYPDDLAATVGDCPPEAGAWIRFNPVDGCGIKNENVIRFNAALVESDDMPIQKQYEMYKKLQLPVAALVYSGGKSLHAIIKVDAPDKEEYQKRVEFLYAYLQQHGVSVDTQNKNPSRLSRMPGVTRNGKQQSLIAINIGRKSWDDWMDYINSGADNLAEVPGGGSSDRLPFESLDVPVEKLSSESAEELSGVTVDGAAEKLSGAPVGGATDVLPRILPPMVSLSSYIDNPPPLANELIAGILRCKNKMIISGASKSGKSFLLVELCIAIAEGQNWLGFPCRKGRVLYVNLEIDYASCVWRFIKIYKALGIEPRHVKDIVIWNLRGYAVPLDKLVPELVNRASGQSFDAIIVDPIYKVITGDENSASEMAYFCNQFDEICTKTGSAVIYAHHHSKGLQGAKKIADRASGSGVFARDPDAQLDMIQLKLPKELQNSVDGKRLTAWRLESSLREFPNITPVNFWFTYPIHRVDETGILMNAVAEGSAMANLFESSKFTMKEGRRERLDSAYEDCSGGEPGKQIKVTDMAKSAGVDEKTIRRWIKEFGDDYQYENGVVKRKTKS